MLTAYMAGGTMQLPSPPYNTTRHNTLNFCRAPTACMRGLAQGYTAPKEVMFSMPHASYMYRIQLWSLVVRCSITAACITLAPQRINHQQELMPKQLYTSRNLRERLASPACSAQLFTAQLSMLQQTMLCCLLVLCISSNMSTQMTLQAHSSSHQLPCLNGWRA